ncbi:zinc finger HIT domain-containing protein 2-like [Dorcoceras hygrometricum]|uniref:Zinc finger HIT domain-containing protein 2-like n=1 Tax=Dorcoceras hygrometricum TaxID=472368 RepID=A0A2Z6ZRP4_9LAMI|nr:zinc finger HIT domain-containing protein 2-like [Dorcoceras hygrometricum]
MASGLEQLLHHGWPQRPRLCAMIGTRRWVDDAAQDAASVRPCAACCVGGGRRPAILVVMRRLFCFLGFVSGLSRAAHEVFGQYSILGRFWSDQN